MVADKRKPRDKPPPYQRQPKKSKVNDTPATSAQPAAHTAARQNLTLNDWLTVFLFRAYLRREELLHGTQTIIDSYDTVDVSHLCVESREVTTYHKM
jgi:hypothetical protein